MKKLIAAIMVALPLTFSVSYVQSAEVQKVCIDKVTKDGKPVLGKDGKQVQECKEMKVHKKLEGTKVPEKK
jgi:hypothetical protein